MLSNNANYPYPVLRTTAVDYNASVFNDDCTLEVTPNGYKIITNFSVNNDQISEMINQGILNYALYISCKSTLLREMKYTDPQNPVIEIGSDEVHYLVSYLPYIICTQDIERFSTEDFVDDYTGIDYRLESGSIIGIGTDRQFHALFEKDIIRDASSIIEVQGSDNEKFMKIDLEGNKIKVILPADQCGIYKNLKGKKNKYSLANSVVIIPALIEAISLMRETDDDDEPAKKPWFLTLQKQISEISRTLNEPESKLYDYPARTAQIIMSNNSGAALKAIEEI